MARTDWYAYTSDEYGNSGKYMMSTRLPSVDFVKEMANGYRSGNEIMFRRGISKENFVGISCENAVMRQELIDKFKFKGIDEINGTPIDKFIKVSQIVGK